MSIFQCQRCGCAENTATGWFHSARKNEEWFDGYAKDEKVCSACAPTHYKDGRPLKKFPNGWHGYFKRTFLPHGMFFTNDSGMLEHVETGLIGNAAYDRYGRDEEYPRPCI